MFTKEEIQAAKDVNLVELLQDLNYGLKKITDREYALLQHNSCRISPDKGFYWFSRDVGGNAVDFFITVENMSFKQSVGLILSRKGNFPTNCREVKLKKNEQPTHKIAIPPAHWNNQRAIMYLADIRKIDMDIILYCIKHKKLYESSKTHNVVFLGYSKDGKIKYASQRGTTEKKFAGDVKGSQKEYGFFLGSHNSKALHIFESPIDLLSYLTLNHNKGIKNTDAYLALTGVSLKGFEQYIKDYILETVYVRTDNDEAGKKAVERLRTYCLSNNLKIAILPAHPNQKDYNDELKYQLEKGVIKL